MKVVTSEAIDSMLKIVEGCDEKNCEFRLFSDFYIEELNTMAEALPRTSKKDTVSETTIANVN